MSSLPTFKAREFTDSEHDNYRHAGVLPVCGACGEAAWDLDEATGLDRSCWRATVLAHAWALRDRVNSYEPKPLPEAKRP